MKLSTLHEHHGYHPTWAQPDVPAEAGEIQRTALELGLDEADVHRAFEMGELQPLDDQTWQHLQNTDSWGISGVTDAYRLAGGYGRDINRVITGIKRGATLPAPMILVLPDGTPYLVGGNTRLMAARALGVQPLVFVADLEAARRRWYGD